MTASPPPVYVISLPRCPDRRALVRERMEAVGVPFSFVDAVDGHALSEEETAAAVDTDGVTRRLGRVLRPGEVGCALSHRAIYQRMVEEGTASAVVLEDDAIPDPDLPAVIERLAAGPERLVLLYHVFTYVPIFGRRSGPLLGTRRLFRTTSTPRCTVAYYLTLDAARVLLAATEPIRMQADWPVRIEEVLDAKVVHPHVVHQDVQIESTISDHDHVRRWHLTPWDVIEDLSCIPYLKDPGRWEHEFGRFVRERMLSIRIQGPPHQPCVGCGTAEVDAVR